MGRVRMVWIRVDGDLDCGLGCRKDGMGLREGVGSWKWSFGLTGMVELGSMDVEMMEIGVLWT